MGIFDFFRKKHKKEIQQSETNNITATVEYDNSIHPKVKIQTQKGSIENDTNHKYVRLSTSGDENVCPMCAQFEGKIFLSTDAPKLPLCPNCACAYEHYDKADLPPSAIISNKDDFVLPAECTPMFYTKQQKTYSEADTKKLIQLCESQLKKIQEFMAPYISANFPAPTELACRDLLPDLYMRIGNWAKAEKTIKKCIEAKAYHPKNGSDELADFKCYQKVATETLSYISQNPGCLQRNIYKKMGYEGEEKEQLKYFLRYSKLIRKVKSNNTNQLFCNTDATLIK